MFKLDHRLSPNEFISTFFEVNRKDHQRPPHPWETLFRTGQCSREQLQGWAKERYYFVRQVPTKEYSILYNCPHPEVRRMWLPKAIEEEGEDLIGKPGKPHPEYWLQLCAALGLNREYVIDSEPLFGVKFAVDSFANAAFKSSWLLGVAVSEGNDTAQAMPRDLDVFRKRDSCAPGFPTMRWSSTSSTPVLTSSTAKFAKKFCKNTRPQESFRKIASTPS